MTTFFERAGRRGPWRGRAGALLLLLAAACQTPTMSGGASALVQEEGISPKAQRRFADAVRAYEEGKTLRVVDWEALAQKFEAVLREDARHAEAHFNLGAIAERQGDTERAIAAYEEAIRHRPDLAVAHERLGALLERTGRQREAEARYKELLRVRPEHAGARAGLARLYLAAGRESRALEVAQEALMRDPTETAALHVMAEVRLAWGEHEVARLVVLRAMQLDEQDPEGPYLLARIWEAQGKQQEALAELRRAAALSSTYLPARLRLAEHALRSRSYEEAVERYEELVRLAPSAPLYLNLGIALHGAMRIDEAMAALQRAEELDPEDLRPLYSRALILHRHLNDPEEALTLYRRFVSEAPMHLSAEHPVFAHMRECEQLVFHLQEARALEEAARLEAEAEAARLAAAEAGAGGEAEGEAEGEQEAPRAIAPAPQRAQALPAEAAPAQALDPDRDPDEPVDDY